MILVFKFPQSLLKYDSCCVLCKCDECVCMFRPQSGQVTRFSIRPLMASIVLCVISIDQGFPTGGSPTSVCNKYRLMVVTGVQYDNGVVTCLCGVQYDSRAVTCLCGVHYDSGVVCSMTVVWCAV